MLILYTKSEKTKQKMTHLRSSTITIFQTTFLCSQDYVYYELVRKAENGYTTQ